MLNLMKPYINDTSTSLLDTPVPDIRAEVLRPTPPRQGLIRSSAKNVAKNIKRKWNEFYNWLIDYVPQPVRVDPTSVIAKFKKYIKELYNRVPDFTPSEKSKGARGYFKTYTITLKQ